MEYAALLALAVADSVNPSAIVVALYLLTRPGPAPQVLTYIGAIFLTYFTLGLLLSGVSLLWPAAGDPWRSRWGLLLQMAIGSALRCLAVYNLIFVLPPLLLLAGHELARGRLDQRYAALRARPEHAADETTRWIAGLVGGGLLVTSVIEYAARYW